METEEILAAIQKAADTIATPNWAAVMSAIASVGAVIVAVVIAIKQVEIAKKQNEIAEKQANISIEQNKIALFEKRFRAYDKISKIIGIAHVIEKSGESSLEIIYATIASILEYNVNKDLTKPDGTTIVEIQCTREFVKQASFLFAGIDRKDVDILWSKFQGFFLNLTLEVARNSAMTLNQFEHPLKDEFIRESKSFGKKYTNLMRESLDFNEVL